MPLDLCRMSRFTLDSIVLRPSSFDTQLSSIDPIQSTHDNQLSTQTPGQTPGQTPIQLEVVKRNESSTQYPAGHAYECT